MADSYVSNCEVDGSFPGLTSCDRSQTSSSGKLRPSLSVLLNAEENQVTCKLQYRNVEERWNGVLAPIRVIGPDDAALPSAALANQRGLRLVTCESNESLPPDVELIGMKL